MSIYFPDRHRWQAEYTGPRKFSNYELSKGQGKSCLTQLQAPQGVSLLVVWPLPRYSMKINHKLDEGEEGIHPAGLFGINWKKILDQGSKENPDSSREQSLQLVQKNNHSTARYKTIQQNLEKTIHSQKRGETPYKYTTHPRPTSWRNDRQRQAFSTSIKNHTWREGRVHPSWALVTSIYSVLRVLTSVLVW